MHFLCNGTYKPSLIIVLNISKTIETDGWAFKNKLASLVATLVWNYDPLTYLGKGAQKKLEKKLTNVSFMYVCVAGNGEMLVFFSFFPPTIVW